MAELDSTAFDPSCWRMFVAELRRILDTVEAEYARSAAGVDIAWLAQATGSTVQLAKHHAAVGAAMELSPALADAVRAGEVALENVSVLSTVASHPAFESSPVARRRGGVDPTQAAGRRRAVARRGRTATPMRPTPGAVTGAGRSSSSERWMGWSASTASSKPKRGGCCATPSTISYGFTASTTRAAPPNNEPSRRPRRTRRRLQRRHRGRRPGTPPDARHDRRGTTREARRGTRPARHRRNDHHRSRPPTSPATPTSPPC